MSVTIDDVARYAKVSRGSVTNVINNLSSVDEKIRQKVLKSIQKLNYVPNETARRLRLGYRKGKSRKKTYNIGCVLFVREHPKFSHPFHVAILNGIDLEAIKQKYHMFFIYTAFQLDANLDLFGKVINPENVDGIITIGSPEMPIEKKILQKIKDRVSSIVCLGVPPRMTDTDIVDMNHIQAGYEAVKYLVGLGHRRIGYLGDNSSQMSLRFEGYSKALNDFGLEKNIIENVENTMAESTEDVFKEGYESMNKILERAAPLPTAVFVCCDEYAIGAIKAVQSRGLKIPDDISIIGVSDIEEAKTVSPPLTTFRFNKKELGSLGVKRLIERIDNPGLTPAETFLPFELIVRKSCRSIK
jgi:LacI family transcriptional regulator